MVVALDLTDFVEGDETLSRRSKPSTPSIARDRKRSDATLYFDLETIPDYSRKHLFGLPELVAPIATALPPQSPVDELLSPSEFTSQDVAAARQSLSKKHPPPEWVQSCLEAEQAGKNRKGIRDLLEELLKFRERHEQEQADAAQRYEQAQADQRKAMSVNPWQCRIIAIGYAVGDEPPRALCANPDLLDDSERQMLAMFWELVETCRPLCGFNVLGFDLPVIFARSILLGVEPKRKLDLKPWGSDVVDVMAKLFPKGPAKRLKDLAGWMGIEIPAGDVDGSQVEELWKSDPPAISTYVRSDVQITRELHQKYQPFLQ